MRVLSFDCANRSLAVCYATVNENIDRDISNAIAEKNGNRLIQLVNNYVNIHLLKVFDLTKGKKCSTIERTQALKKCLQNIDLSMPEPPTHVLVEYQMSANDKSRCVSQQILYHYAGLESQLYLVGPTLKNKVAFSEDLDYGTFISKYASKYTANKNHTKANFLHWLKIYNKLTLIKDIKKKNIDDAADAFMQIIGWLDWGKH